MEAALTLLFDEGGYDTDDTTIPTEEQVYLWIAEAIALARGKNANLLHHELSVSFMSAADIQSLNKQYRDKDKPTNVLSFPSDLPQLSMHELQQAEVEAIDQADLQVLGDIILCPDIVIKEAQQQGKAALDHWAHMLVHGTFHLFGMDHQDDLNAKTMESLEIQLLSQLGIDNPYEASSGQHQ